MARNEVKDWCVLTVVKYQIDNVKQEPNTAFRKWRSKLRKSFRSKGKKDAKQDGDIEILLSDQTESPRSVLCVRRNGNSSQNMLRLQVLAANVVLSSYYGNTEVSRKYRQLMMPHIAFTDGKPSVFPYSYMNATCLHLKIPISYLSQVNDSLRQCDYLRYKFNLTAQTNGESGFKDTKDIPVLSRGSYTADYIRQLPVREEYAVVCTREQHDSEIYSDVEYSCTEEPIESSKPPIDHHASDANRDTEDSTVSVEYAIPHTPPLKTDGVGALQMPGVSSTREDTYNEETLYYDYAPVDQVNKYHYADDTTDNEYETVNSFRIRDVSGSQIEQPNASTDLDSVTGSNWIYYERSYAKSRATSIIPSRLMQRILQQRKFVRLTIRAKEGLLHVARLGITIMHEPNTVMAPTKREIIFGTSENPADFPVLPMDQRRITPVLVCMPHQAIFNPPLSVSLPLLSTPDPDSKIKILHSDTEVTNDPRWQAVNEVEWFMHNEQVTLYLQHFSFYCVVEEVISVECQVMHKIVSVFLR